MKQTVNKWLEVAVESINYVLISYALSNMALVLRQNPLSILFFASEVWLMSKYWQSVFRLTQRKAVAALLLVACFLIQIALVVNVNEKVNQALMKK